MKILLSTDRDNLESNIAKRFGHANYYLIYCTDSKSFDVKINEGHDDEHSSLIKLARNGIHNFIVGNVGPNAFKVLKENNARLFLARKLKASEALEKFLGNKLDELFNPTIKQSIEHNNH